MRNTSAKLIAVELKVSIVWVRALARRGTIPATKKGRSWYFNVEEVRKAYCTDNSFRG
ncbi:MAG: helix-turn-helix domain-containing protein [Candidatus Scalindua sp.]|nr:helix-turn-helix domain-containing protein [Candidatus Scalindua sp.]